MDLSIDQSGKYGVEVSGWNAHEDFFVEKSILDWTDKGEKCVELRSQLREGSVLFVRLIQRLPGSKNFPVPYRVIRIQPTNAEGHANISIEQLRPLGEPSIALDDFHELAAKVN
jgi:hypothetical protein